MTIRLKQLTPMVWFTGLLVVAIALALLLPPDPHALRQLHISSPTYRVAIAVLLVPYALIWYAGFYTFAKLQEYTRYIKGTVEGKAFRNITVGMGVLAFGLIIPTILSLILGYVAQTHSGFKTFYVVVSDYVTLLAPLVAFTYISTGSHTLVGTTKIRLGLRSVRLFGILFILLGTAFIYVVVHNPHASHTFRLNTFFLLFTFIAPYLYIWFAAFMSAFEFRLYSSHVKGVLYKQALMQFAFGIWIVILGDVAIQFMESTIVESVSKTLGSLLLVEYVLLLVVAAGLVVMVGATSKLRKIEEV